jgi:uncharacterized phiE125 gp8 family phage protein
MRVDTSDDDTLIGDYVSAATAWCQNFTERQFINATWKYRLDKWPTDIVIPISPLSSVTSIQYIDADGATQTLSSSEYTVDTAIEPGRIVLAYGKDWPNLQEVIQAVIVTFVAGYGSAGSDVPQSIRTAVRILTAHWYEIREPIVTGTIVAKVPMSIESILWQYRTVEFS